MIGTHPHQRRFCLDKIWEALSFFLSFANYLWVWLWIFVTAESSKPNNQTDVKAPLSPMSSTSSHGSSSANRTFLYDICVIQMFFMFCVFEFYSNSYLGIVTSLAFVSTFRYGHCHVHCKANPLHYCRCKLGSKTYSDWFNVTLKDQNWIFGIFVVFLPMPPVE